MVYVTHKFRNHRVSPRTEILIVGTFNPDIPTGPSFFYGRGRNYLWQLLPGCWGLPSLKLADLSSKLEFMTKFRIDFVDLIGSVCVPQDQIDNVDDDFIDSRVYQWKVILETLPKLKLLKAVYFTRKTLGKVPSIHKRVLMIQQYCKRKNIRFCLLHSPARSGSSLKQQMWLNTIVNQTTCLNA